MEKKIFNTDVTKNSDGYRLDKFLQSQLKEFSRTRIQGLIKDGYVEINDITINIASKKIKEEDQIKISFPAPKKNLYKTK